MKALFAERILFLNFYFMKKITLIVFLFSFLGVSSQTTYFNTNTNGFEVSNSLFIVDSNYIVFGKTLVWSSNQFNLSFFSYI